MNIKNKIIFWLRVLVNYQSAFHMFCFGRFGIQTRLILEALFLPPLILEALFLPPLIPQKSKQIPHTETPFFHTRKHPFSTHGNTLFPHTERGIFHTHISIVLVYKIFVYNQYILFVGFSLFEGKNRNKIDDYFGENYGYTFSNPNS